jgi:nucleotide-binding universal stress UspA family protein
VLVANVFPYEDHPSRMANLEFRKILESDALKLVGKLSNELAGLDESRVRTAVVAQHSPAHGLHALAEIEKPELLVVGSSHVGVAGRVMPGSTGERLLHGAGCPVAIVPRDYRTTEHELRRIGVAYNGTDESDAALHAAAEIARATGAKLLVIRVMDATMYGTPTLVGGPAYLVPDDVEPRLRKALDDAVGGLPSDVDAEAVFLAGDPVHELVDQTGTLDLLVTGARGYGPLRAVLTGGVTGRLLRDAKCPVIVLPRGVTSPLGELFAGSAGTHA